MCVQDGSNGRASEGEEERTSRRYSMCIQNASPSLSSPWEPPRELDSEGCSVPAMPDSIRPSLGINAVRETDAGSKRSSPRSPKKRQSVVVQAPGPDKAEAHVSIVADTRQDMGPMGSDAGSTMSTQRTPRVRGKPHCQDDSETGRRPSLESSKSGPWENGLTGSRASRRLIGDHPRNELSAQVDICHI